MVAGRLTMVVGRGLAPRSRGVCTPRVPRSRRPRAPLLPISTAARSGSADPVRSGCGEGTCANRRSVRTPSVGQDAPIECGGDGVRSDPEGPRDGHPPPGLHAGGNRDGPRPRVSPSEESRSDSRIRRRIPRLLTILAAAAWTYASVYPSFGVRSPGDIAGLPLLVALFSLFAIPFRPAELFASRSREGRADRFSLQLTDDPASFAAAMVKLHDLNLGVADPRRWERWLFYSHPTRRDRVEMARAFQAAAAR